MQQNWVHSFYVRFNSDSLRGSATSCIVCVGILFQKRVIMLNYINCYGIINRVNVSVAIKFITGRTLLTTASIQAHISGLFNYHLYIK